MIPGLEGPWVLVELLEPLDRPRAIVWNRYDRRGATEGGAWRRPNTLTTPETGATLNLIILYNKIGCDKNPWDRPRAKVWHRLYWQKPTMASLPSMDRCPAGKREEGVILSRGKGGTDLTGGKRCLVIVAQGHNLKLTAMQSGNWMQMLSDVEASEFIWWINLGPINKSGQN